MLKGLLRYNPLSGLGYSSQKGCFTWLTFAFHRGTGHIGSSHGIGPPRFSVLTDIHGVENESPQNIPLVLEAAALTLPNISRGIESEVKQKY